MKILFLTSRLPYPPDRGDRVRTFNFLRRLSQDHDIRLLSFVESDEERAHLPALEPFCRPDVVTLSRSRSYMNMLAGSASSLPFQTLYYRSGEMARKVKDALSGETFDLIYTHLFRMVPYAPDDAGIPRIVDLTDCISRELAASVPHRPRHLRLPLRFEVAKIRRYEARVSRSFDEVWAISEADRHEILKLAPESPVFVVPNGVDEALYAARPAFEGARVGFLGNLSVPHNVDAARFLAYEIMPGVRAECPGAELELFGASPSAAVRELRGAHGTFISGPTPDLRPVLERLSVFACPLRFASGIQNKILEAMAAGVPVVTTSLGNLGLGASPDRDLLVRDDPGEFVSAVVSLMRDPRKAARIGERGRAFVRATYSWDAVADRVRARFDPAPAMEPVPST